MKKSKSGLKRYGVAILVAMFCLSACDNEQQKSVPEEEKAELMVLGDSIANELQNVLLQNVAKAIQKGGADYAVAFCNTEAMPLTDSVSASLGVYIQRLSDKNRNPKNALASQLDSMAWNKIKATKADFVEQVKNGEVYYYKPIAIKMPTCLKCHGDKKDIAESTQSIISQKYPLDKATGYSMGALRGMWKIKLKGIR